MKILRDSLGCDFLLSLPEERSGGAVRLLQLTDTQIIDSSQRRTPDRLRVDEILAWSPDRFDQNCFDHIRALVTATKPDLIFITGDIVYGSFDDSGATFERFCEFMDSLEIPWAPVFGNHDNESARGVAWQCERFSASRYCLFARGNVSGNSNYTVGISVGGELLRVIYMIDSNGARGATDPAVIKEKGIYPDQIEWMRDSYAKIVEKAGRRVPTFLAFHIPTTDVTEIEIAKGYRTQERTRYAIGVDAPAKDGDFGANYETHDVSYIELDGFRDLLSEISADAVFVGHCHSINTVISHGGVSFVFGLKTGQYDYHNPYQLGGTAVSLTENGFEISHVPALVRNYGFPGGAKIFADLFACTEDR